MVTRPDHDEDRQPKADGGCIEPDGLSPDQPGRFQRLQPAPARVLGQPHPFGEVPLRLTGIALEGTQDGTVKLIYFLAHLVSFDTLLRNKCKNFSEISASDQSYDPAYGGDRDD